MTGYCIKNKEKECENVRQEILRKNKGKLPKKYKHTSVESCLYCSEYME